MTDQFDDQPGQDTSAEGEGRAAAAAAEPDALDALRREKDTLQDRLLRTAAEFDNYRKRVERERRELSEYAGADVLTDLLPIIDNLDRALQAPATGEAESFRRG